MASSLVKSHKILLVEDEENIALGMENAPKQRDLAAKIKEVSHQYGLPLDPYMRVGGPFRGRAATR